MRAGVGLCRVNDEALAAHHGCYFSHEDEISTETSLPAGHWLPLERKEELVQTVRTWLRSKDLRASTTRVSQTWIQQPDDWRLAGIHFSTLGDA